MPGHVTGAMWCGLLAIAAGCVDPVSRSGRDVAAPTAAVQRTAIAALPPAALPQAPDSIAIPTIARVLATLPKREPTYLHKRRICMLDSGDECGPTPVDTLSTAAFRVLRDILGPAPARDNRAAPMIAVSSAILRGDTVQFLLQSSGCTTPFRDDPINFVSGIEIVGVAGFGRGDVRKHSTYVSDGFSAACPGADRIQRAHAEAAKKPQFQYPRNFPD